MNLPFWVEPPFIVQGLLHRLSSYNGPADCDGQVYLRAVGYVVEGWRGERHSRAGIFFFNLLLLSA